MPFCPLKPTIDCAATFELATSSRCIGCPLLDQCDQAMLHITWHHDRGGPHGSIGILVQEASA
jgi:hypothetical protein